MKSGKLTSIAGLLVLLAAVAAATSITVCAHASSPLPDKLLGHLETIRIGVSSGDLGFEPVPGLDYRQLEVEMRDLCANAMAQVSLPPTDLPEPPEPFLLISVDHAWNGSDRTHVALLLQVSLGILASPVHEPKEEYKSRHLEIWSDDRLELVPSEKAREKLLESLRLSLDQLEGAIQTARRRVAEP